MDIELRDYFDNRFASFEAKIDALSVSVAKRIDALSEKIPPISEKVVRCETEIEHICGNCFSKHEGIERKFDTAFGKIRETDGNIEKIKLCVFKINNKISYYVGGLAAAVIIVGIIIKFIL